MATKTRVVPSAGRAADSGTTSTDSGMGARPRATSPRPQEGPLRGAPWPAWLSWCAALLFFAGVVAIVCGTLLQLTRELVELGHHGGVADAER